MTKMHILLIQLTKVHGPKRPALLSIFCYAKLKRYLNGDLLSTRESMHTVNIAILVGHVFTQSAESKADKSCKIDLTKKPDMSTNQADPEVWTCIGSVKLTVGQ